MAQNLFPNFGRGLMPYVGAGSTGARFASMAARIAGKAFIAASSPA
jgi:hypothetical protein